MSGGAPWRDRKRPLWLMALAMPLLPFAAVGMFAVTGLAVFLWLGPLVILGVVPLLDLVCGEDPTSPPDDVIEELSSRRYYRWITYLFLPLQYAGFVVAFVVIASGDLSAWERVGLAVTVGFIGGLGINTAHELGHKKERAERRLSRIALAQSGYGHFYIEHNRGHHVRVATPDDPASSRLGESFYAFWPRTVFGSVRSAWRLEAQRLRRRHRRVLGPGNDVLSAWAMTAAVWIVLLALLGAGILPFLLLQALVAITLLEAVNYLEHYGMLRRRVGPPGSQRYERVDASHSWNSNHIATNVLLYHLQRHSDHHARPTHRYQVLRTESVSPTLPTGYAGMILLALVPPLWRRVMDPRVAAHYSGDISRANISPRMRERMAGSGVTGPVAPPASWDELSPDPGAAGPRWTCPCCAYVFDERRGDAREGFPAGTTWAQIPLDWCCPDCGVRDKVDFVAS